MRCLCAARAAASHLPRAVRVVVLHTRAADADASDGPNPHHSHASSLLASALIAASSYRSSAGSSASSGSRSSARRPALCGPNAFPAAAALGSVPRSAKLSVGTTTRGTALSPTRRRAPRCGSSTLTAARRTLAMFISAATASRGLPFWLVALSAHTGVEVQFCHDLCADLPVGAPTALLAAEARLCSRFALVMSDCARTRAFEKNTTGRRLYERAAAARTTYLVADRVGCSRSQALCVMRELAKLHAHFWNRAATLPEWLVAHRHGAAAGYLTKPGLGLVIGRGLRKWRQLDRLFAPSRRRSGTSRRHCSTATAAPRICSSTSRRRVEPHLRRLGGGGMQPRPQRLVYFIVVGLAANDAVAWESGLLDAYHGELKKRSPRAVCRRTAPTRCARATCCSAPFRRRAGRLRDRRDLQGVGQPRENRCGRCGSPASSRASTSRSCARCWRSASAPRPSLSSRTPGGESCGRDARAAEAGSPRPRCAPEPERQRHRRAR